MTLDRLEAKRMVCSYIGTASGQRGGRRRKHYLLDTAGQRALLRALPDVPGDVRGDAAGVRGAGRECLASSRHPEACLFTDQVVMGRDPGSGIRDPGSGIRDPGSGIRDEVTWWARGMPSRPPRSEQPSGSVWAAAGRSRSR